MNENTTLFKYDTAFCRKLIRILIQITVFLIAANVINELLSRPSWQITRFIAVGKESNFPTWFSSGLLMIAAYFTYNCSLLTNSNKDERHFWSIVSLGLLFLSCDETAMIHEYLGTTLSKYIFHDQLSGMFGNWTVALTPVVLLFLVYLYKKYKKIGNRLYPAAKLMISGLIIFLTGAVGFEVMVNLFNRQELVWLYKTELIVEESLEMIGVIFIIAGAMRQYEYLSKERAAADA